MQLKNKIFGASVSRPVIELKAFRRITLKPGKSQIVELTLISTDFSYWNRDLVYKIESTDYEIMLGNSSNNIFYRKKIKINN